MFASFFSEYFLVGLPGNEEADAQSDDPSAEVICTKKISKKNRNTKKKALNYSKI